MKVHMMNWQATAWSAQEDAPSHRAGPIPIGPRDSPGRLDLEFRPESLASAKESRIRRYSRALFRSLSLPGSVQRREVLPDDLPVRQGILIVRVEQEGVVETPDGQVELLPG